MKFRVIVVLFLILVITLAVGGCIRSAGNTPEVPALPAEPAVTTYVQQTAVTTVPVRDLASIRSDGFRTDPSTGTLYEFTGKVLVLEGVYSAVQVRLLYPDGTVYTWDAGGMGGSNVTTKPFFLYPDSHYQSVTPEYRIVLDGIPYSAGYRYDNGKVLRVATTGSRV